MRFLLVLVAGATLTALPASAVEPVCALLDAEKTPRAALLEAKLLAASGSKWVERADIDKALKEQQLAAAFGAQGVKERLQLGKLLKADVLILVREVKGPNGVTAEVIVSETAGGLRLLVRGVPITKDTAADVAALLAAATAGIKKHGEEIKLIVAAPPFVSTDLTNQFDHLKGAFARLVESVAFDRKGAVVVEFAEAEALSKELALTAPGAKVARPLPLYLIGEYRHNGTPKDRTVALKLRAERGGKAVGKAETATLKPDDAPAALRKWTASVLEAGGAAVAPPPDPKIEVARLNELASTQAALGHWLEALSLIEASLLLDPKQPGLNAEAMRIIQIWLRTYYVTSTTDLAVIRRAVQAHRRGLEHLEAVVTADAAQPRPAGTKAPARHFYTEVGLTALTNSRRPAEGHALLLACRQEHADVHERLLPLVAKHGPLSAEMMYVNAALMGAMNKPLDEVARLERMLLGLRDLPGAKERFQVHLIERRYYLALEAFPAYYKMLDKLSNGANAEAKAAVALGRTHAEKLERDLRAQAAKGTNPITIDLPPDLATATKGTPYTPLRLTTGSPATDAHVKNIQGLLAAGPGTDVLWSGSVNSNGRTFGGTVYVMKEAGKLRACHQLKGRCVEFVSVAYDGRYVWGTVQTFDNPPVLFVLDPVTEKAYEFGEADGLPTAKVEGPIPFDKRMLAPRVAVLEPGRVCVAGSHGRGWVAVATYDPKTGGKVAVIHEAKEAGDQKDRELWKKSTVAFHPAFMSTLRGEPDAKGRVPIRVLIVRYGTRLLGTDAVPGLRSYPLLVDPDAKTAEVMEKPVFEQGLFVPTGGVLSAIWGMSSHGVEGKHTLLRQIDASGKSRDLGPVAECRTLTPAAHFDGKHIHLVRSALKFDPVPGGPQPEPATWWVVSPDGKSVRVAATNFPTTVAVATSAHYGTVALVDLRGFRETALCAVKLEPPPEKK